MPDGFTQQSTIDESGAEKHAARAFFSVAGVPDPTSSARQAEEFIDEFSTRVGDQPVDPYGVYGAQAAQIVLDAIANSDYTRAGVIEQLFATEVEGGFLGDFSFTENGDPTLASGAVIGFTIFRGEELSSRSRGSSSREEEAGRSRSGGGERPGVGVRASRRPPGPLSARGQRFGGTLCAHHRRPLQRNRPQQTVRALGEKRLRPSERAGSAPAFSITSSGQP